MSDLRARIADAVRKGLRLSGVPKDEAASMSDYLADALLALPDIAIVELPSGYEVGPPEEPWLQFKNVVALPGTNQVRDESTIDPVKHTAATARVHAASLLAAANAAEAKPPVCWDNPYQVQDEKGRI